MVEQGTPEWHQQRLGKVTASRISDVMMKPTTAGFQNYKAQLICERLTGNPTEGFTNTAMQWGTETEPQARAIYEMETGLDVSEVGFVDHPSIAMSGASPDGLAGEGLVEIKCPNTATHLRSLTGGDIDRKYLLQMQWQMACTERAWCDFVTFDPRLPADLQILIRRVEMDKDLCAEITKAVTAFLDAVDADLETLSKLQQGKAA